MQFLKNFVTGDESRVRPGDKTAIVTVEGSHVSATKEGAPSAKQNKGHVTGVFFLRVSYTTSTLPTGKKLIRSSKWRSYDFCVNQFAENDRKNGGMATGSCTTTMHSHTLHIVCSSFWSNTSPPSCSSHHTHRVTFSYSKALKSSERTPI